MENVQPSKQPIVYAIPGLGVDGRIFGRLQHQIPLRIIEWKLPLENESLTSYAERMAEEITHTNVIVIGYSFGGVIAQEIASRLDLKGIVLINTLQTSSEKPFWLRLMSRIPFYKLARGSWRIRLLPIYGRHYGIRSREDLEILARMFADADNVLRMWSVSQLASWKEKELPGEVSILRLHGWKDKVFPIRHLENRRMTILEEGRHFMVWQESEQIADLIRQWLGALED